MLYEEQLSKKSNFQTATLRQSNFNLICEFFKDPKSQNIELTEAVKSFRDKLEIQDVINNLIIQNARGPSRKTFMNNNQDS